MTTNNDMTYWALPSTNLIEFQLSLYTGSAPYPAWIWIPQRLMED